MPQRLEDILSEVYARTQRGRPGGTKSAVKSLRMFQDVVGIEDEIRVLDLTWPVSSGLLCWWTMDDEAVSGTTLSDRYASVDGTISGAITSPGKIRESRYFDGVDDYIDFGAEATLHDLTATTWEFWAKPTADNAWSDILVSNVGAFDPKRRIYLTTGGVLHLTADRATTDVSLVTSTTLSLNAWAHVAITWTLDSQPQAYINGTEASYTSRSAGSGGLALEGAPNNAVYSLGAEVVPGSGLTGYLDEFRIYNRALSAVEITRNYRARLFPPHNASNPLYAEWPTM